MIGVGATVGNYEVVKQIGHGAMGIVFLAHHPVIGKRVALKVIHPELSTSEEMLTRFFNEARAVTQIGHENIVDVQDFGQTPDGDSFIVMELLEGRSLGDKLKGEGALSVSRAVHIALQLADGLSAAHERGIVHRDLKPDNIFLIERGGDPDFVKILDFGLAKLSGPSSHGMQNHTKTGSLLGTPHYMAPEQAENVKSVDHRADVYSLGCILFQMLAGRVPFPGEGFGEVLVRHMREPPPLPSRLNPAVPPAIEKIVLHALAKRPEFRFASMDQFRAALRDPERFAQSLDSVAGVEEDVENAKTHERPAARNAVAGTAAPPDAPPKMAPGRPAPRAGHDARTLQAPAPQIPAGPQAMALSSRRPDPERIVHDRPQRPTVLSPHRRERPPSRSRSRRPAILVGVTIAIGLGCAALAYLHSRRPTEVAITVVTTPPGAEIIEGGQPLGLSPIVLPMLKSSARHTITIKKDGFLAAARAFTADRSDMLLVRMTPEPKPEPEPEPAMPTPADAKPTPVAAKPIPVAAKPTPVAAAKPTPSPAVSTVSPRLHQKPPKKKSPQEPGTDALILTPSF